MRMASEQLFFYAADSNVNLNVANNHEKKSAIFLWMFNIFTECFSYFIDYRKEDKIPSASWRLPGFFAEKQDLSRKPVNDDNVVDYIL